MIEISEILDVKQHLQGLKAVIFDLDDTLYGEKEYVRSGYCAVAKELPMIDHAETRLWEAFQAGKPAIDTVLLDAGIEDDALKKKCLSTYRYQIPQIHFYPGVPEMLEDMTKMGYFLGIITDGRPEGQRAKIAALGLERYVDHIIITDDLGGPEFRKPCEKAFCMMQEVAKVPFAEMCYVGDNTRKDFIAPNALGMQTIWFRNSDGLYQ